MRTVNYAASLLRRCSRGNEREELKCVTTTGAPLTGAPYGEALDVPPWQVSAAFSLGRFRAYLTGRACSRKERARCAML